MTVESSRHPKERSKKRVEAKGLFGKAMVPRAAAAAAEGGVRIERKDGGNAAAVSFGGQ